MRSIICPLLLVSIVSCCKTIKKPEPEVEHVAKPLVEQVAFGHCTISFSPDALGVDGTVVELTVSKVYYGIFLISYNDFITVPCETGDVAIFQIDRADGTFLRQRSEVILPPKV